MPNEKKEHSYRTLLTECARKTCTVLIIDALKQIALDTAMQKTSPKGLVSIIANIAIAVDLKRAIVCLEKLPADLFVEVEGFENELARQLENGDSLHEILGKVKAEFEIDSRSES